MAGKAMHLLMQDVRTAYWRAASAQQLLASLITITSNPNPACAVAAGNRAILAIRATWCPWKKWMRWSSSSLSSVRVAMRP